MEGFLSLEQAAQQLDFSIQELSRQIEEGRVVAIVREGNPWLSAGEVSRLKRQSDRSAQTRDPAPSEELRLLRLSPTLAEPTPAPSSEPSQVQPETKQGVDSCPESVDTVSVDDLTASAERSPPSGGGKVFAELNKRCAELELRNQDLEATLKRLKSALQETEATLKRNRTARANLENDVISLQEQLNKAKSRSEGLEREVQALSLELERSEDTHNSEIRRMRSKDRQHDDRESQASSGGEPSELEAIRFQMMEKDRLLAQEYEVRGTLRSKLEDKQQKYFELKARYEKEKSEWSEILAREIQNQGFLRQHIEDLKTKETKGWNPFRRDK